MQFNYRLTLHEAEFTVDGFQKVTMAERCSCLKRESFLFHILTRKAFALSMRYYLWYVCHGYLSKFPVIEQYFCPVWHTFNGGNMLIIFWLFNSLETPLPNMKIVYFVNCKKSNCSMRNNELNLTFYKVTNSSLSNFDGIS